MDFIPICSTSFSNNTPLFLKRNLQSVSRIIRSRSCSNRQATIFLIIPTTRRTHWCKRFCRSTSSCWDVHHFVFKFHKCLRLQKYIILTSTSQSVKFDSSDVKSSDLLIPNTTIPILLLLRVYSCPLCCHSSTGRRTGLLLIDVAPPPPLDLAQSALPITNVAAAAAPTTSLTPGAEEGFQRSVAKITTAAITSCYY